MTGAITRFLRYGSDLAIWLWTILFKGESCHPYNVGSDQEITIAQLAETVASTLGGSVATLPPSTLNLNSPVSRYVPSVDQARLELNLRGQIPLNESIRRTASWHAYCR